MYRGFLLPQGTYSATLNADLEEVGVLGGVLLVDKTSKAAESVAENLQVLGGLNHQFTCITLGDLDVALEDGVVAEAKLHGGNSHSLGNGAEVENTLLAQTSQVEEAVLHMLQSIQNHVRVAVEGSILELGLEEVLEVLHMSGPDLLGPETAVVVEIFADITDDVGLLQEETHGLVEAGALEQSRVGQIGLNEQAGQTLTNQTSDVVAVQVVLLDGLHTGILAGSLDTVVGHTVTHLIGDILDDGLVGGLHVLELGDNVLELNQQFPVLLLGAVSGEVPAILLEEILEAAQKGLLCLQIDRGVILDGVETAQGEVEHANGKQQLGVQLLNDGAEATASQVEELEALLLCLGLVLDVALVGRVVPDLPASKHSG